MAPKTLPPDYRIEPLRPDHDRAGFFCGIPALDQYVRQQAGQDLKRKVASVSVLTADGKTIAGFYTLSALSIDPQGLPIEVARKLPRLPIPVTLLGRMAVSQLLQGRGLGEFLLLHALEKSFRASQQVASWAVVVDSKAGVRSFYLKRDFLPLPIQPDRLYLAMKTIEEMFKV